MERRYPAVFVEEDLASRMVFIGGPRQVGKTTFALSFLNGDSNEVSPAYLNWDSIADREKILEAELPPNQSLLIFDEIHKFGDWRNLIKGIYDKNRSALSILVTGSARLDYYRKGGDSLQGRYHYYRLHPFSLPECSSCDVESLLHFGGFPEPLFRGEERFHRRWLREQSVRLLYEDLRDLENVKEISKLELLLQHLPRCVGSPLSVNRHAKLLQVSPAAVDRWISIFERLYLTYRIAPFGTPRIRAVKKENKLYFWDWSRVSEEGPRFENMVAGHLLKYCHFSEDTQGHEMELRFIRDTDKREVDFVVLKNGVPEFAVECKTGERKASPHCTYFRERTGIPCFYQVHLGSKDYGNAESGTRVLPFSTFCKELSLV